MLGTGMLFVGGLSALTFADRGDAASSTSTAKVTARVILAAAVVLYVIARFAPNLVTFQKL